MKKFFSELRIYFCNHWLNKIPSHNLRGWYYKKIMAFELGNHCSIMLDCSFDCKLGLSIGSNSVINSRCRFDNRGGITIGENVSISEDVIILTADHDMNSSDFAGRKSAVHIHDYVWIGTRAMILPGVTIGKGAVVAAGSIVTKNVAAYTVVAGVPAKTINKRNEVLNYTTRYNRLFK